MLVELGVYPSLPVSLIDFREKVRHCVTTLPPWIVGLKLPQVADVPDVIANAVLRRISQVHPASG